MPADRTWEVPDTPCPRCGTHNVFGFNYVDGDGGMMHTHYICRYWPSGTNAAGDYHQTHACGWHDWSVPQPDEIGAIRRAAT